MSEPENPTRKKGDAERWRRIRELFAAALAVLPAERDGFLDRECGGDGGLRDEVGALIASFEESETFLETPAAAGAESLFEEKAKAGRTTGTDAGSYLAGTVLLNRYRILGLVGRGGMGEVYRAEDIKLGQEVALKFLPERLERDADALRRFHSEVRLARQVSHPNVCRVFDIGEADGRHFLSMEYVDGDDLSSLLRRVGRLPSERAVEIARQLCVGLGAIHNAGILHRDLKPANVIIDSKGKARITDFGIAGAEDAADGLRVGTPAYMSPEQIAGTGVTPRSDVYALGLVLYEIFTGKQAFRADSIPELIRKHQSETPTNPSEFVKGIDPLVEAVIGQCLEKDPARRPPTALHVAMALPGGNPMQIALDAGQTPSPEMVAAAPKKGVLPVRTVVLLLAFFAVFLGLSIFGKRYEKTYNVVPLNKPQEALAERARLVIGTAGYNERPMETKHKFIFSSEYSDYMRAAGRGAEITERIRTARPHVIRLLYRESPVSLAPWRHQLALEFDPPFNVPGMINVEVDTTGRLIKFAAVAPASLPEGPAAAQPDWSRLFAEAGLDIAKFKEVGPNRTPNTAFTSVRAWKGVLPEFPDHEVRVEAAEFYGRPVHFELVYPWTPNDDPASAYYSLNSFSDAVSLIVMSLLFTGTLALAVYNIRTARADLRGSLKIAVIVGISGLILGATAYEHTTVWSEEIRVIGRIFGDSLFYSFIFVAFYLGLEPFFRKLWPEAMVSWSRVLTGDLKDPLVGRDLLVGSAVAASFAGISGLIAIGYELGLLNPLPPNNLYNWNSTRGMLQSIGEIALAPVSSAGTAFGMYMTTLFFLLLTRNKTASAILFGCVLLLLGLSEMSDPLSSIEPAVWALMVVLCIRYLGIFGFFSVLLIGRLIAIQPITVDPQNILFPQSVLTLIVVLLAVGWAARTALGGKAVSSER